MRIWSERRPRSASTANRIRSRSTLRVHDRYEDTPRTCALHGQVHACTCVVHCKQKNQGVCAVAHHTPHAAVGNIRPTIQPHPNICHFYTTICWFRSLRLTLSWYSILCPSLRPSFACSFRWWSATMDSRISSACILGSSNPHRRLRSVRQLLPPREAPCGTPYCLPPNVAPSTGCTV